MRIVVIGAAPTGLGVAYRLHELQNSNVEIAKNVEIIVLEKELFPGGLSCTFMDENGFQWDMGSHITFSHNLPYYEKAVRWAVNEWNIFTRNSQVDVSYMFNERGLHLVPYPAQYAVPLFPMDIKENCLKDLRERCSKAKETNPLRNFDQWIMKHFGPTLRDYFFIPYTQKVWTVKPEEMNPIWVGTRVAKIPHEKLEELCAMNWNDLKERDLNWGPNAQFIYPKYDGTGSIWKAMASKLPSNWIRYGCKVIGIDAEAKLITYENEQNEKSELSYDVLINTGPIDQLVKCTKLCRELDLKYNKVFVVGIGLKKPINPSIEQVHWIYFPEKTVPFYRLSCPSNFGELTPDNTKYWSVTCECARSIDDDVTEQEIMKESIESLIRKSIISQQQIVSQFSRLLPYGYPIPTTNRDGELTRAHRILEKHQIFSRGRFGGWKYEASNQDHCFIQGKEIIDRLLLGEPETLYRNGLSMSQG